MLCESRELVCVTVRKLQVQTTKDYSYSQNWYSVRDEDHTIIRVMACADAHILLSNEQGTPGSNTYEVALGIGGNTDSVIRESPYGPNVVWINTLGILSCDTYR